MTRSIAFAALLAASVAACAQKPIAPPPPAAAANLNPSGFIPYCGPVWSVGRQGYVEIPCPAGTNYDTLRSGNE
ncbi:MAG TPA: hypothetical protein VK630_04695 [Reyranella sp.]|nr:hypothetical protein [Reyranella sp.]